MSTPKANKVSTNESLPLRVRVFSKWASLKLRIKGIYVTNIINQIKNGVILVNLAEVLTKNTKHKTWTRNPTKTFQYIENIELALYLFTVNGVRFHYQIVTPKEISEGNMKSINSLVWSLIMKYTIEPVVFSKNEIDIINEKISNNLANLHQRMKSKSSNDQSIQLQQNSSSEENNNKKEEAPDTNNDFIDSNIQIFKNKKRLELYLLLQWCISKTKNYTGITNCKPVHLALAALLNNYRPDVIKYQKIFNKNDRTIANYIIKAMKILKIPNLVEPEDLLNQIDGRSFFTQVAIIKEIIDPTSFNSIEEVIDLKKQINSDNEDNSFAFGKSTSVCSLNAYNEYDDDDTDDSIDPSRDLLNLKIASDFNNFSSSGGFSSGSGSGCDNCSFSNYEKPVSHRPFVLLMIMDDNGHNSRVGKVLAMTVVEEHFLNPAGYRIDLRAPNPRDPAQQFTFGEGEWITVIDSVKKPGMVWDVACADNTNPPEGTPFYLFPFHGNHNQRFTYKQGRIIATQNMQAVTFVGNEYPFVMKKVCESSCSLQIFELRYL